MGQVFSIIRLPFGFESQLPIDFVVVILKAQHLFLITFPVHGFGGVLIIDEMIDFIGIPWLNLDPNNVDFQFIDSEL